jgi:hypothetical protein
VAELVDALASGASGFTAVKVRVLSWAPLPLPDCAWKYRWPIAWSWGSMDALEFHPQVPLEEFYAAAAPLPSLTHVGNGCHDIVGQVVYVADDWWIINAGFLVFEYQPPPAYVRRGGWLRGNVYIGVDPYFYFEQLGHEPGAPALIYDWKIEKIEMQTAPSSRSSRG